MNLKVKKLLLTILYFPFQLIIQIILSPIILGIIACKRAENQAFEDVYMTKDNPWLNQEGPTMTRKKFMTNSSLLRRKEHAIW